NGGATGAVSVNTGPNHTVGELAGTGTNLSDYTSSIACTRNGAAANSGPGTSLTGRSVARRAVEDCNTRKTRDTGTSEVRKDLSASTDPSRDNHQIGGTTSASDDGNGGTTGAMTVNTGANHTVGELAGTGTALSDYSSSTACTRNGSAANSGSGTSLTG